MHLDDLITQLTTLRSQVGNVPVLVQLGKNELGNSLPVGVVEVVTAQQAVTGDRWIDSGWFGGDYEDTEFYNPPVTVVSITN